MNLCIHRAWHIEGIKCSVNASILIALLSTLKDLVHMCLSPQKKKIEYDSPNTFNKYLLIACYASVTLLGICDMSVNRQNQKTSAS